MTRINFGPDLDELSREELPDPIETEEYRDDICELFGQVYTEEAETDTFIDGELDFNK